MRTSILLAALFIFFFESCKRSGTLEERQDTNALYERFNGRYEILSATASDALDLNFDGIASTNLKEQISGMGRLGLQVQISDIKGANSFDEFWPEPFFDAATPKHFDSTISVNYSLGSAFRTFEFSKDLRKILLNPENPNKDLQRHPRPDSVIIRAGDIIEVTKQKDFYSILGWKKVTLVIEYLRFSKLN